jgi:outer membrane protein assembly factor BamB
MQTRSAVVAVGLLAALTNAPSAQAPGFDWPQWRGPDRSGVSREKGLLAEWPSAGPTRLWTTSNLGAGYGSVSIAGDRVFVQGSQSKQSTVSALNRADGKLLWTRPLGPAPFNDRGSGPRGTPTVDGDRLYVLTENGDLFCLRVQDGTPVWNRNILREFGARNIGWLVSESPLVDGNMVVVTPGGRGAGMAALDKMTGKTVWTTKELSDEAGYASVIAATVHGIRTYMTLNAAAGVGVRASDGKLMWRYRRVANYTANITTPVFHDNKVFYSSSYDTGGALLNLTLQGDTLKADEVYFTRELQNHHGGIVALDGYLYGYSDSILTCLELATGKTVWRHRSVGKGSVVAAEGKLYILGEDNVVGLADASPAGYRERGRFRIDDQGLASWAHPAISDGRLYIRNQGTLAAYNIRK